MDFSLQPLGRMQRYQLRCLRNHVTVLFFINRSLRGLLISLADIFLAYVSNFAQKEYADISNFVWIRSWSRILILIDH